ncbi:MAG: ABC transporter permease [Ureaplasma sp.]|nr:ABC transporter permease [Ureaplasma sp.]MDE7221902.1 ABC transporter permease [Ureaplasma sp.]
MNKFKFRTKLISDSFIYTKTRKSTTRNMFSIIGCITIAIIVSLLIATIVGYNPITILTDLFTKGFIDPSTLIWNISILGIGALAFSFAFRAGIFNIGIPGQLIGSGLILLVITRALDSAGVVFPTGLGQIFALLVAMMSGMAIASITSLLKVYLKVNEVVSSILLNWIIYFAVRLIIFKYYNPDPGGIFSQSMSFPEQFRLISTVYGGLIPTIIIFIVLAITIAVINKYTTFGHKIYAVGCSKTAARYAGYNYKMINISTMAISGALVGVMALVLYTAGQTPSIPINRDFDTLPVQGFSAITIGLIALNNPIGIIPVAFLMGLFQSSSPFLSVPPSFSQLIMGMIILGAAMFVILLKFKPWLWFIKKRYGSGADLEYQEYENKMETLISQYILKLNDLKHKSSSNEEINLLTSQYLQEKQDIKKQYKKRILVFKATKTFYPEIQTQNTISIKNNKYDQQLLNSSRRHLHHLSNMVSDKNNLYDNILFAHNSLFKQYDSAYLHAKLTNKLLAKSTKNDVYFLKYIAIQFDKYNLFNMTIDKSIEIAKSKANDLAIDLENVKNENHHRFMKMLEIFANMTHHKFDKKVKLWTYVNEHFNDFCLKDKYKIYHSFYKYQLSDSASTWTVDKLFKHNPYNNKNLNLETIQLTSNKFIQKFEILIDKYLIKQDKIDIVKNKYEVIDIKNKEQIDSWKIHTTNYYNSKLKSYKTSSLNQLENKYKKYSKEVEELNLSQDENKTLQTWLLKSFEEAQKNFEKGGN